MIARRVALIVSLTSLIAILLGLNVRALVRHGPGWIAPLRLHEGEIVVGGGLERNGVPSRLLEFSRAGLRSDDVIEAIQTGSGAGGRLTNLNQLLDIARLASRESVRLVVRRPSEGGRRLTIDVPATSGPRRSEIVYSLFSVLGLSLVSLVTALLLGLLRPDDTRAFTGSLMFLGFACLFAIEPLSLEGAWRVVGLVLQVVGTMGTQAAFLWFFLVFPTPSVIDRRLPWLKVAAVAFQAIFTAGTFVYFGAALHSFEAYTRVEAILPDEILERTGQVTGFVLLGIGIVSLVLNTLRRQSRDERRRMVIVLTGTLVGLGSFVGGISYYTWRNEFPPLWVTVVFALALSFFPLSFVYAIVRHRVLGTRFILRRGVQYALVSGGVQALIGGVAFTLFWVLFGRLLEPVRNQPVTGGLLAGVVVFLLARLFRKLRDRIMPAIDRRFFRDAYDAQRVLTELSHSVRELALEPNRLLGRVVDAISAALHPRTTAIFLKADDDADARQFRCVTLRRDEGQPLDIGSLFLPVDGVLASRLRRGEAPQLRARDIVPEDARHWASALVADPSRAGERAVVTKLGARLVVPLLSGHKLLGMLVLGDKRSEEAYSRDDRDLLLTVAEQTALALDYGELARQAAREESLRREVEIARSVQVRLFPQVLPPVAGLDYSGVCRPAREIGGDSYDFIALGPGRLGLAVADISGKGVAAALLMANLQALLRSRAPLAQNHLGDLAADINRLLAESIPDNRFATFFYGVLDTHGGRLTYVNAGHNPPLLLRGGRPDAPPCVERLAPTGMMLGMFPEATFTQHTVDVRSGDVLVAYSDGVCDALNPRGEDYGDGRLEMLVRQSGPMSAGDLQDRIIEDVSRFGDGIPPFDDMTIVVARVL